MASFDPNARPVCAVQEDRPKKTRISYLEKWEKEMLVHRCWCGNVCTVKEFDDFSYTKDRRFFMCPNYDHDKLPPRNAYDRAPSPPPLCKYYTWIDHEQPSWVKHAIQMRIHSVRERYFEEEREREAEEKRKIRQEKQRKEKEEEERLTKEAREAERARKRKRARLAQVATRRENGPIGLNRVFFLGVARREDIVVFDVETSKL